ncbi:coatomer subunit alpha [Microbotryum lychnidis-dioicae p1A1 Lamole]|uniref:Coatomer subunit alpha n=1 Tax=Microbotryum lychnidis-dioicae (strain p1A1 Lamole / MvSl-1064) TaxID=683840 RepID=U5H4I7_USTV1|nr:coatomer subunit alpha [Microbotryum lychnidis-dioicae p1A1 Lamole]|eukprot:KDE07556.1 coatomer subunit alpha [Microbotryum lychnidis-dioicae p1A1 Lamole]
MQMLTKFESKSNRVKGIAFHPRLTLLAASLHSGSIQLWNFQMGVLVDRFEEHDGPVRGISFHSTQPLFCSGGDDYKIKVWNYKTRRCLFTLHGHLDYVRSVYFHHEHPWILSASDDQTIRIWNWQSRQCIAILTGHNHYIMCAQFHPKEDYVVSASMDQTVRVWDISGLRKKNTTAQPLSFEEQIQRANSGQADLFGNTDAVVKYVLEGHDRGVNWATFHPTMPLIVSCGDDRQIKLWRMSDTKAWEVDTCRGHFNNVSVALFHPKHELIISDSEDKTIRVWDLSKRTAVQTFRRENDRFWVLTAHPELNLFAAGHDSGLIVFKLDRERPAFSVHGNTLFYVRDKFVRAHDFTTGSDASVISVRRLGSQFVQPRTLSYNPAERAVIVTSPADNGLYELVHLPKDVGSGEVRDSASEGRRGTGSSALFVARNRLAVLDKTAQTIEIRDLENSITKTIKCPVQTNDIFFGGTASLLLSCPASVVLFDIQQQKIIAELATPLVKYVVWSNDNTMVALLSKHTIMIANKTLGQSAMVHETIRIKSGAWDDSGIFIYSTLNHIKYALPQGDNGIIKTLEQPVYLTHVKGKVVHCLDRNAKPRAIVIDPTEYRFKLALMRKNYDEVLHIIRTSNLVGQSIIAYLQKKGFPEIALHFVQDKTTRVDLAIECGNLDVALEMAKALEREEIWARLGQQALKQGHHKIVEIAYQRTKNFDRLSFLYLITGHPEKLSKMSKIAEMRGDQMSRFHNALYLGNVEARIAILREVGLFPLAYMTAKTNGLEELAQEVLTAAGLTEEDVAGVVPPIKRSTLRPPPVIVPTFEHNWPSVGVTESFFDRALAAAANGEPSAVDYEGDAGDRGLDSWAAGEIEPEPMATDGVAAEEAAEAWDLDGADGDDDGVIGDEDLLGGSGVLTPAGGADDDSAGPLVPGIPEDELWVRNSPLAADHVAAGSFETAMGLLNRQVGAVHFAPLKPLFLSLFQSSRLYLPSAPSLPPLQIPLRRNLDNAEPRSVLPAATLTLQSITSGELRNAYLLFQKAKFPESAAAFRSILHSLLFVVTSTPGEAAELQELVVICREYLVGLALEIERRRVEKLGPSPENTKRQLELAAYFTHCRLQPAHLLLALRLAMATFVKAKNYPTAATFAQKLLDLQPAATVATQAKNVLSTANKSPRDAIEIAYDLHAQFDVCPASLTPIYANDAAVEDPFTGSRYHARYSGTVCAVSGVTEVGRSASGVRSMI